MCSRQIQHIQGLFGDVEVIWKLFACCGCGVDVVLRFVPRCAYRSSGTIVVESHMRYHGGKGE